MHTGSDGHVKTGQTMRDIRKMGLHLSRAGGGLARPLDELRRMWPREVLAMPVAEQAELADSVCRSGATDVATCRAFLVYLRSSFPHEPPMNATGVGNIAFLSLYADDPAHRAEFATVHGAYILLLARRHGL